MAVKDSCDFFLQILGDGVTSTMNFTLATEKVFWVAETGEILANAPFNLATTPPTAVVDVYCPTGDIPAITGYSLQTAGTVFQVVFASAPGANMNFAIWGTFAF